MKKMLPRILDYFLFWSLCTFVADLFDFDILFNVVITLFLPLLFIPIEMILVKMWQRTLGTLVFGLYYPGLFTWKEAFFFAVRRAFFLKTRETLLKPSRKRFRIFILTLITATSLFSLFPDYAFTTIQKWHLHKTSGISIPLGWVKPDTKDLPFLVFFPSEPAFSESNNPIPHSSNILVYREYTHESYSLGYVDLPSTWVKWGSNLVFKGTLQQILSHEKGDITQKRRTLHEDFPALDYQIRRGGTLTVGRLILVENTLYKLEFTKAASEGNLKEDAQTFFSTFHLIS